MQRYLELWRPIAIVLMLIAYGRCSSDEDLSKYLQPDDIGERYKFSSANDAVSCTRECLPNAPPRICYYKFHIEEYATLSDACYNCTIEGAPCNHPDCITADGFEKGILSVNRRIPGPSIQVCLNDRIVVDVINEMTDRTTTIHWHGIFQRGTQYCDGVPDISQCPIQPGTTFRYDFFARQAGSFYWHSHDGAQKLDGIQGSLIIRRPKKSDPSGAEYDYDLPAHTFFLQDWLHYYSGNLLPGLRQYQDPSFYAVYYLINGRGRYKDLKTGVFSEAPYTEFLVEPGKRYRFRFIGATCRHCSVRMSIQGHRLKIIATDGNAVKPFEVDYIDIYTGERYDFVLTADNENKSYWIQTASMGSPCDAYKIFQLAKLTYVGAKDKAPLTAVSEESVFKPPGVGLNPINSTCHESNAICVSRMESIENFNKKVLKVKPDVSYTMTFGYYYPSDKQLYQSKSYMKYSIPGTEAWKSIYWVNNISFKHPSTPLISSGRNIPPEELCPTGSKGVPECKKDLCECCQILKVPLGAVAEFRLIDKSDSAGINHAFHLHGYAFNVMAMGNSSDLGDEKKIEELVSTKKIPYSPAPVLKDTIAVPSAGYTVVRIVADNPGYWLFHCHFVLHHIVGMSLVVQVGEPEDLPALPKNFPVCGNWKPSLQTSKKEKEKEKSPVVSVISGIFEGISEGIFGVTTLVNPNLLSGSPSHEKVRKLMQLIVYSITMQVWKKKD